jgi:L,D-transpeptidase catalytic domain
MSPPRPTLVTTLTLLLLPACGGTGGPAPSPSPQRPVAAPSNPPAPDPFEAWRQTDFPAADGFDSPLTGHGSSAVQAVAHGRVAFAGDCGAPSGHVVMIDHVFYENHERRLIRSVHKGLATVRVQANDIVKRADAIGAATGRAGDAHFELRWDTTLPPEFTPSPEHDQAWIRRRYAEPARFVAPRRRLAIPQDEPALLLVSTSLRRMRVWLQGDRIGDYEVAFGQEAGRKRRQHDLRTPLGMYFVVEKSRGPFSGPYGAFYGGHWIKVNYPNPYDAAWGRTQRLVGREDSERIGEAWRKRMPTWQGSPLGGGIGFHGWADDWDLEGPRRLSWGCVVMRNEDIRKLFDWIPVGAMVVIL